MPSLRAFLCAVFVFVVLGVVATALLVCVIVVGTLAFRWALGL